MAPPTLADRVAKLETDQATTRAEMEPLREFRAWGIAVVGGGILALAAAGVMYGSAMERLDRMAADVAEIRQELNARGSMHARAE